MVRAAVWLYSGAVRVASRFAIIALLLFALAATARSAVPAIVFAHGGAAFGLIALAYVLRRVSFFGKDPSGRIGVAPFALLWPVHAMNALTFALVRLLSRERHADEIVPGVLLGRRLAIGEDARFHASGARAVLDLTGEFIEPAFARSTSYRCIPLLDLTAPTSDELRAGVEWLRSAPRPVYVHCALGHGRSATFVAAWLLATGAASTPDDAIAQVRARRPRIGLNPAQQAVLRNFSRT